MAKKHYCRKCQNLIKEGKEIKFSKGTDYYSSRYSSGPRSYITYYLCPKCFEQQRRKEGLETKKFDSKLAEGY